MHPTSTSLPGSNFRLATLTALAAIAVGATVIDIETLAETGAQAEAPLATVATTTPEAPVLVLVDDTVDDSTAPVLFEKASVDGPPETASAEAEPVVWRNDDFADDDAGWAPMSGVWAVDDGAYTQSDSAGFDLITQLDTKPPAEFGITVEMTALGAGLGGGIIIGQPVLGSRAGATLIDFTDSGNFLRWGTYDETSGQYEYLGGLAVDGDFDPAEQHTLTVESRSTRTQVLLDGEAFGDFAEVTSGYVGLATSTSSVAFDNVEIVEL